MKEYIVPIHDDTNGLACVSFRELRRGYRELIRCKDCKWWNDGKQECIEWYDSPYAPADGYCFRAERKEEE